MRAFESFVLEIPYLFLRRVPYTWIPIVAFWTWPPYVSGIFLVILLVGIALMLFQQIAWEHKIEREQRVLFRDQPQASFFYRARNLTLLLIACAALGWLFDGRFNLNALQWTVLLAGVMITYEDHLLFGRGVVYLVTDKGIAVRYVPGHVDNRLFFGYDEIRQIVQIKDMSKRDLRWNILSPTRKVEGGLLLVPNNPDGFSRALYKILLTPTDRKKFLQAIPATFLASEPRQESEGPYGQATNQLAS